MRADILPLLTFVGVSLSFTVAPADVKLASLAGTQPPNSCTNTPTSGQCWGKYSINTNYYTESPYTNQTLEIWLSAEESICNQDVINGPA